MALTCPSCDEAAEYVGMADDGRNEMRCGRCGEHWLLGARPVSPRALSERGTQSRARGQAGAAAGGARFPTLDDLGGAARERVARLDERYRAAHHRPDPKRAEYRERYRHAFSADGLPEAEPQMLKDFANSTVIAHPGNMSVFNREWNRLGERDAAARLRAALEYLLRGPESVTREDRFTELVDPSFRLGMTGFRESLLTRVLCVVEPERYVPILIYSSSGDVGKREIARRVLGVEMPPADRTAHTIGRLSHWSNDLLVEALDASGVAVTDRDYVSGFLWWAKDQA